MTRFHFTLICTGAIWLFWLLFFRTYLTICMPATITAAAFLVIAAGVTWPSWNFFGNFINSAPVKRRSVALTFDDGPHPDTTDAILDFLDQAGVSAAFFCAGSKAQKRPDLMKRMSEQGHLVCNHSFAHHPLTNFFSTTRLRNDIAAAQSVLRETTGLEPVFFRPPMGLSNPRLFAVLNELGLQAVGWTARAFDRADADPESVAARLMRGIRPGAILLLHDGKLPPESIKKTLRLLLDNLNSQGYQVERLDMLLLEHPQHLH